MKLTVKKDDTKAHKAKIKKAGLVLTVGVHGDAGAHSGDGISLPELAAIHEYGLGVPARPFLGPFAEKSRESVTRRIGEAIANGLVKGGDALAGIRILGEWCVGQIKAAIAAGIPQPNAPSTVARKGSSKPLIDTGQLRNSITYKVSK